MKKNKINIVAFSTLMALSLAFKVGDQIELENYVNARSSAKFLASSKNIQTQLSKGTHGEVVETKRMPSGNYGIQMKVDNGPHAGETYWVYYNNKAPQMKIFAKDNTEVIPEIKHEDTLPPNPNKAIKNYLTQDDTSIPEIKANDIPAANSAKLIEDMPAIRAPEEAVVIDAAKKANETLAPSNPGAILVANPNKGPCPPEVSAVSNNVNEEDYKESDVVPPFRAFVTRVPTQDKSCNIPTGTKDVYNYTPCFNQETKELEGFKIKNTTPNKIATAKDSSREFMFSYDERAGSDMKIEIHDAAGGDDSADNNTVMLFFPRTVLPAVKQVGDQLIVTLPNREIVRYNAMTKEIIGGVFSEGPITTQENKKVNPTDLKYTGNGVMIRADKNGALPYGNLEAANGTDTAASTSNATISKKGFKDCSIPSKDIWYTKPGSATKNSRTYIKQELATDAGMDEFIKARCGFSLF